MNKIYSQQIEAYMWSNTSLIHQHYNASHWLIAKIRSCILFQIIDLPCRLLVRLLCAFTKVIDNWSYNAPFCLNFAWPTPCLTCNILRYISIRLIISAWEGWEKSTIDKLHIFPIYLQGVQIVLTVVIIRSNQNIALQEIERTVPINVYKDNRLGLGRTQQNNVTYS